MKRRAWIGWSGGLAAAIAACGGKAAPAAAVLNHSATEDAPRLAVGRPVEGFPGFTTLADGVEVEDGLPAAVANVAPVIAPDCAEDSDTSAVYRLDADVDVERPGLERVYVSLGHGVVAVSGEELVARQTAALTDCMGSQSEPYRPWATDVVPDAEVELVVRYLEGGRNAGESRLAILKRRGQELVTIFEGVTESYEGDDVTTSTIELVDGTIVITGPGGKQVHTWDPGSFAFVVRD